MTAILALAAIAQIMRERQNLDADLHDLRGLHILLDDWRLADSVVPDDDCIKIFSEAGHFTLRYIDPLGACCG